LSGAVTTSKETSQDAEIVADAKVV